MKKIFDRRDFLRLVGCSSPFLFPIFSSLRAEAQTNLRKKIVFIQWSNGWTSEFTPKSFGTNFKSSYVLDALAAHKKDLTVLHRFNTRLEKNVSHTSRNMLTAAQLAQFGKPQGPSIDEYLGPKLGTPIPSLKLNIDQSRSSTNYNTMSWKDNGVPVAMIKEPLQAYNYAFKNFKFPESSSEVKNVAEPKNLLNQKRSIVDLVKKDFQNLKRHLAKVELAKFEAHFDLFRTFEKEIEDSASKEQEPPKEMSKQCEPLKLPTTSEQVQLLKSTSIHTRSKVFAQIAVAAMACNRTDITTMLMSEGVSAVKHSHLNGKAGIRHFDKSAHHNISHYYKSDTDSQKVLNLGVSLKTLEKMKTEIDKWYAGEMSYLVSRMKEFDVFKNSYVIAGNDMGGDSHKNDLSSFVTAGNLGGFFKNNFAKDYKGSLNYNHSAILAAVLQGFGRKGETFGYKPKRKPALQDIIA